MQTLDEKMPKEATFDERKEVQVSEKRTYIFDVDVVVVVMVDAVNVVEIV